MKALYTKIPAIIGMLVYGISVVLFIIMLVSIKDRGWGMFFLACCFLTAGISLVFYFIEAILSIIKAIKKGVATIKATTVNGLEQFLTVAVTDIPATNAFVDNGLDFVGIKVGDKLTMELKLFPLHNTTLISEISYESRDANIVTVSNDGKVHAVGVGQTQIFIYLEDKVIGFLEVLVLDS